MNISFLFSFLFYSVIPQTSYEQLLINEAQKAFASGQVAKATTIYESAKILLPKNKKILLNLAIIYKDSGYYQKSITLYKQIIKNFCKPTCQRNCYTTSKCKEFYVLKNQLKSLKNTQNEVPLSKKAPKLAKKIFRQALHLKKKHNYKQALKYLLAVSRLNPDLPGTYRHLGELYSKLKQKDAADKFYLWYLKTRPGGINASRVRKKLSKKAKKLLGKLSIKSSHKCYVAIGTELIKNKRGRKLKTPIRKLSLPEGHYGIGFICSEYHLARRFWVDVKKGKTTKINFKFGALKVKIKPWARVLLKNPKVGKSNYKYMDLGLFDIIGLPVGKYTIKLIAFNKTKSKEIQINIKSGKTVKITKW